MNDNQLIYWATEMQNEIATACLYQRYEMIMTNISQSIYYKFFAVPLETNDLMATIYFNFYESLKQFQMKKPMSFKNFLLLNLKWAIISYLKKYTTKSHQIVNLALQYEALVDRNFSPWVMILNQFLIDYHLNLSQTEKNVLKLKQRGFPNQEIMQKLDLTYKQVDNSWQRIILKVKKAIN